MLARQCYLTTMKKKKPMVIKELDLREDIEKNWEELAK